MLERCTVTFGAAFSPFLYFVFVANMTMQLCINNIYDGDYASESAIRHNIITLWRMAEAELFRRFFSRPNVIPNY